MKVLNRGHVYKLNNNKSPSYSILTFFKDKKINGEGFDGTTNQEVLRALIDRIKFLDKQKPHPNNIEIIKCLRKAIVLHEQRHLDRMLEKDMEIENLEVFENSHIVKLNIIKEEFNL